MSWILLLTMTIVSAARTSESAAANAHEQAQHCDGAGVQCLAVPGHLITQARRRRFAGVEGAD